MEAKALQSEVIDEKNAKELTDMLNEEKREKKVFEQTQFDYEDNSAIKMREQEAMQLIKDG